MLAADALGMATCPITLHSDEDAARVLGLPPGWRCRYAISLGSPSPTAQPARFGGRKPIEEITTKTPSAGDQTLKVGILS